MKWLIIKLIRFYQIAVSPRKRHCCRFYPSCSRYALQAFRTYSLFKAFRLSVFRLLRCNPFVKGGYDPVRLEKQEK